MLINYSTTDINIFLSKAEQRLVSLGEELVSQIGYGDVEEELLTKIELLTAILDGINDGEQKQIDVLVYFALDYFNLAEIAYSPFSILPTTVIGQGGSGGVSSWDDLLDKPLTFPPSIHTHPDEQVLIDLAGITEFRDRFGATFIGTLEKFIETLMIVYQPPSFTSFSQDKGAAFEIGQSISGNMNFSWSIANPTSIKNSVGSGSITISEASPFSSNTVFNLYGSSGVTRVLSSPYKKNVPGSITFTLNGVTSKNQSMNPISTSLTWYTRIYYGNSASTTLDSATIATLNSQLSNSRQLTTTITGSGYKYVFIPDTITQENIKFIDPNSGFEVAMNTPTNAEVTNPQGLLITGKLFRTKNFLGGSQSITIQ